jgi:hypothetical protein
MVGTSCREHMLKRLNTTYDGVRAALADRSTWRELEPLELARLVEFALYLYGRNGEVDIIAAVPDLYSHFAERAPVAARRDVFARLSVFAREREIRRDALYAFLRHEDDPQIVSRAAFDLALYHEPEGEDAIDGPGHLIGVILKGGIANPGAALAGLLLLGDAGVCARLAPLRPILAKRELEHTLLQVVTCTNGELHAATIEFYLEWLEELIDVEPKPQAFTHVASGLAIQRRGAHSKVVMEGRRRFPVALDGTAYEPGARMMPLREFRARIAPRLERLERLEAEPKVMTRVKSIWLECAQDNGAVAREATLH